MKENKTLLNWMIALSVFVIWGNIISLFLSGAQHDAVIKLVDFVSLLFALVVLVSAIRGKEKKPEEKASGDQKKNRDQK
jgi:uncharacterized membrane protein YdjX (TVP38/TMEM64 family)